jgi:D-glycero-D-manno-heptose 1,7-bisphosphate phosphatase
LDRDGVLIEDFGYVNSSERTSIRVGAIEAIRFARSAGYLIFVVTNQAGVARGIFSETELITFNKWLMNSLTELGASVDELVYCPSHPDFGDQIVCECRKPGIGMFSFLTKKWNIDVTNSIMIGDKQSDVEAGLKFGIDSFLINPKSNLEELVAMQIDLRRKKIEVVEVKEIA